MSTFTIDDENNITAYASAEQVIHGEAAGLIQFDSPAALAKVSADWPLSRLVEIWNSLPGQAPVKKFQDRNKALTRLWSAVQSWAGQQEQAESAARRSEPRTPAAKAAKRRKTAGKGAGKQATRAQEAHDTAAERRNKKAETITLMKRAKGATLAEIMKATHWQKHTVRGFVSLLGSQAGLKIESTKNAAGERTYKLCGAPHNL